MKTIFYNEVEQNIRAGWRMGIFALLLVGLTFVIQVAVKWLLPHDVLLPRFMKGEAMLYGALLLATWLIAKFLERRPPMASVGLPLRVNVPRELGQGALLGGGMIVVIFVTEYSLGMVVFAFKPLTLLEEARLFGASGVIFLLGAFGEELLFRGYLFQTMVEGTGKIIAVLVFATFFGWAHANNPNVTFFSLVNVALAGIWLSIAYFKTRSLWFPIALHFSWNFLQNHVFSFPVSGIQFTKFQLGILVQSGPNWFTGGTFGPEGGALATGILILAGAFIYFTPWIRPSETAWTIEHWRESRAASNLQGQQSDGTNGIA